MWQENVGLEPWPLTAAVTQCLLDLPSSSSKGESEPRLVKPVTLALQELIVRGAFSFDLERRRFRRPHLHLEPQHSPPLPESLAPLDEALRPHMPGELVDVLKASRLNRHAVLEGMWQALVAAISARGLVEHTERALGPLNFQRWKRSPAGDVVADGADRHLVRLQALEWEEESDPRSAARALADAGAIALMVPVALPALIRLRRRSREVGDGLGMADSFDSVPEDGMEALRAVDSAVGDADAGSTTAGF